MKNKHLLLSPIALAMMTYSFSTSAQQLIGIDVQPGAANLVNTSAVVGSATGLRVNDGVDFSGTIENSPSGTISGGTNGVYFGNANHTGGVLSNLGTISSDSRALNIDGQNLEVINQQGGTIVGTGSQRNGTVYADSTAQNFSLINNGLIDAQAGNNGAGFSAELIEDGNNFTITNSGLIQGRGNEGAGLATAGDGIRLERTRVGGALDASTTGTFTGTITNSGTIASEGANGTVSGIRTVDNVNFQGIITNEVGGTISGTQNGLYFGNGDHAGSTVTNEGTISSDSRALNIDGTSLTINNEGEILGTGVQRNGTVYSDSTATDFSVTNSGTIDAGVGNDSSGFAAEIGADGNTFTFDNSGNVIGRGTVDAADGFRVGNAGNIGTATVDITNSGTISSESTTGTTAGLRFVNGISFDGTIENSGTISGAQNGVYFGNAVGGQGADHSNGVFTNTADGVISSDSRAFNIDGTGLTVNNSGSILGTGDQRNGTVYVDGTANDFTINNLAGGLIDGGAGNESSAISIQVGSADGDIQTASINNQGTIQGRGTGVSAGIRLANGAPTGDVTFAGNITNSGDILAEGSAGILIQSGVNLDGVITNSGNISATGGTAIDFSENELGVSFNQNAGDISGDVLLGSGDDIFTITGGTLDGQINGQGTGVVNVDLGVGTTFVSNGVLNVEDYNILSGTVNQVGDFSTAGTTTTVASGATLSFDSVVNGSGSFVSNGTLDFGPQGRLIQNGDVTLNSGSIVEFVLDTPINVGDQIELIDATSIVDNGVTIIDNSVLLNLQASVDAANGDLIVEAVGASLADEFDGNTEAIALAVGSALVADDPSVIGNVAALNIASVEDFDLLAPSTSGAVTLGAYQLNDANLKLIRNQYASGNARTTDLKHGLWIHGLDGSSEQNNQNGIAGFDSDFDGFGIGYSTQINDVRVGVSYSSSDAQISNNQIGSIDTDISSDQIVLFGDYQTGEWFFGGALSYSDLDYEFNRANSLQGLNAVSGNTDGSLLDANLNVGYNLKGALAGFTPIASISYSTLEVDSFNELGGLSLNNVSYDDVDRFRSELGILFNGYSQSGNWTISPSFKLSWKHDFEDDQTAFSADVGGFTFNQLGNQLESDVINAGAGISFTNESGWNIRLDYQGEFSSDEDSQFGSASVEYRF